MFTSRFGIPGAAVKFFIKPQPTGKKHRKLWLIPKRMLTFASMNIKLHTPKSLKMGSGMSSLKQFLLSLFATTVSIALTFGTAGIIDYNKKQKEKREIVMMVMYDMYTSLNSVAAADSNLQQLMQYQLQIAKDTTRFDSLRFHLIQLTPQLDYPETTEHIFSSSIETINTVGNVLFTQNVAEFYLDRRQYKTAVCDSTQKSIVREQPYYEGTVKTFLNFDYLSPTLVSGELLKIMKRRFQQCQQIMDVTDEELESYRKKRLQLEKSVSGENEEGASVTEKAIQLNHEIDDAKKKLKLE